jgi:hypothetical protein
MAGIYDHGRFADPPRALTFLGRPCGNCIHIKPTNSRSDNNGKKHWKYNANLGNCNCSLVQVAGIVLFDRSEFPSPEPSPGLLLKPVRIFAFFLLYLTRTSEGQEKLHQKFSSGAVVP